MRIEEKFDYNAKLRDAIHQKTIGLYSAAITTYCSLVEQTLEHFYEIVWGRLAPDEKQILVSVERQFGKRSPMETLSLGRWRNLYQKSDLPKLLSKTREIPLEIFDPGILSEIVEIRNKCTHEGYVATLHEADTVAGFTERLLLGGKLIPRIPSPYSFPDPYALRGVRPKKDTRLIELANKMRMILSTNPYFTHRDTITEEFGKSYSIDVTCEFVGLYLEDTTIHILLLERDSTYDPDITDEVGDRMLKEVLIPIELASLDLRGITLTIDVCTDKITPWGDLIYSEIKFGD